MKPASAMVVAASIAIIVGGASIALTGYALMRMWIWFIVPLGVAPISFPHALGVGALIIMMTQPTFALTPVNTDPLSTLMNYVWIIARPLIFLTFAQVFFLLMAA